MLEGWAPATYEALAEWASDLGFRCETRDYPGRDGGRNRKLTINGTVSAEFAGGSRIVTVEWGGGCRGFFGLGLPLAALTSLVSGLLAVGAGEGPAVAENYDPIGDLAELVVSALGYNTTDPAHYAGRVTMRLRVGEDESAQAVATALRKVLGLKACRCGITLGAPSEVIPPACPVHGTPCEHCGGTESCKENCNG